MCPATSALWWVQETCDFSVYPGFFSLLDRRDTLAFCILSHREAGCRITLDRSTIKSKGKKVLWKSGVCWHCPSARTRPVSSCGERLLLYGKEKEAGCSAGSPVFFYLKKGLPQPPGVIHIKNFPPRGCLFSVKGNPAKGSKPVQAACLPGLSGWIFNTTHKCFFTYYVPMKCNKITPQI